LLLLLFSGLFSVY